MKQTKNSLDANCDIRSSWFVTTSFSCWKVSGRMSSMNGGEFLMFMRGCWQNFTTLSIIFHDLSIVFRSTVTRRWDPLASASAPWINVISFWLIFGDVVVARAVDLAAAIRVAKWQEKFLCYEISSNRRHDTSLLFIHAYSSAFFSQFRWTRLAEKALWWTGGTLRYKIPVVT